MLCLWTLLTLLLSSEVCNVVKAQRKRSTSSTNEILQTFNISVQAEPVPAKPQPFSEFREQYTSNYVLSQFAENCDPSITNYCVDGDGILYVPVCALFSSVWFQLNPNSYIFTFRAGLERINAQLSKNVVAVGT